MSNTPANMELWAEVCKTPPRYTKKVNTRGGFTAIDPTYQAQRATEVFGPFGIGWGLRESQLDYSLVEVAGLVTHKAVFFFNQGDKTGTFPIHNAMSIWSDKGHTRADEDFAKKLETNTISKALSRLGFSADVFLGLFDDAGYVQAAQSRESIELADDQEEESQKQRDEFQQWATREVEIYKMIPNVSALKGALVSHLKKAQPRCQALGISYEKVAKRFQDAHDKRRDELDPPKEMVCGNCGAVSQGRAGDICGDCGGKKGPVA